MAKGLLACRCWFPRDATGLVSDKPKRYCRTQYSKWVTEKTFAKQYQKIREKLKV